MGRRMSLSVVHPKRDACCSVPKCQITSKPICLENMTKRIKKCCLGTGRPLVLGARDNQLVHTNCGLADYPVRQEQAVELTMADGGFDPCECFWSHEVAMRRLLSILRNSQNACTDSECFDQLPGSLPGEGTGENGTLLMMFAWVAVALLMFLMRPRSVREKRGSAFDHDNGNGSNGSPPPPAIN